MAQPALPYAAKPSIYSRMRADSRQGSALPGFLGPVAHAVYNAVTPRTNEPQGMPQGQNTGQYLSTLAHQFDPRTPAGAASLASILVPGARKGVPTKAQQGFLDAIMYSSRQRDPRAGASFNPHDASVRALSEALASQGGTPKVSGWSRAALESFLDSLMPGQGQQVNRVVVPATRNAYSINPDVRVTQPAMGQIQSAAKMPDMQRGTFPPRLPGQAEHTFQTMPMPGELQGLINQLLLHGRN